MTLPGLVVVFIIILSGALYGGLSHPSHPCTGDLCHHHRPAHRHRASGLGTPRPRPCDAHHTLT